MSQPHEPPPVKLISSLFSAERELVDSVIGEMEGIWGPVSWVSPALFFDRTRYYEKEMGWPLHRRFISFQGLVRADSLADTKHRTNEIERRYFREGKRRINIDPGYISAERLILATGKNYIHRVYLLKGIYADLTLIFHRGSFRPLPWTYQDYAAADAVEFFNEIRVQYMTQLREGKRVD